MSVANQISSIMHDDPLIPLDLRYTDFLNALSEIRDESMRNRCHKYWTSLYRYFDRSMTNERALIVEEKRTHEILHRLDIEIASRRSEIAYQIRDILQREHQILSDLHMKYNRKKNNLKEMEQNIDDLENKIQKQKSERSFITISNPISSSTSLYQITETIDDLKSQIKNLHITRETFQTELNMKKANYFSTQIKVYHLQQNNRKVEKELIEIQHELTHHLKIIQERNNQLNQLRQYKQNMFILINQEDLNIEQQLNNEQKLSSELKKQNEELNNSLLYYVTILKTNQNKQTELNLRNRDLIEIINKKQEEIAIEKELKQEISQLLTNLNIELKRKTKTLSIHHREENKLKNQIIELEHKHDKHSSIHPSEDINKQSINNIKKLLHQEVDHRLKLTIIHYNLNHQINTLKNTTQQYASLVKEQRQEIIHYEKLHDKWILNININRNRLLKLFNRINIIEQYRINTKNFLQQFDHIKLSLRPNLLILYNKMNLFIQQRRDKNEDQCLLNIKFIRMKKILQSNQIIVHQIKQNISLLNKNQSILFNQISTINKQRFYLTQNLDFLQNKFLVKQQQISNISNKINMINLNNQKFQRLTLEKQNIISFLLQKQHLILLINKTIDYNENILIKYRSCYHQLMNKIQQIRNLVLCEIQQMKLFEKQNIKPVILHLRKELLEYKKKNNDFQHRINRRHMTQQILTKFDDKSIVKENNEQYRINLQQKASSIIYRLICKTHYNIILHKHLDLVMQNISLLYYTDQQRLKPSYIVHLKNSLNSYHLNNQLKSSIAELGVLKNEIFIYKQIYGNIKYSLENYCLV